MRKFVLGLAVVFMVTSLAGCGKKKEEASSVEGLNGVVSENVVSVSDQAGNNVAVVVDNAQAMASEVAMSVDEATKSAGNVGKPNGKAIQQALKNAGFYAGKIDGEIGPKTKKAIEAFQAQNGLKADGKVGSKTWKALSSHLSKTAEVVNPSAEAQTVGQ